MADSMPSVSCLAPSGDARGQRRDVAAFEAIFRAHYPPLCDYVYGYVRSRAVAQELVQDLFHATIAYDGAPWRTRPGDVTNRDPVGVIQTFRQSNHDGLRMTRPRPITF